MDIWVLLQSGLGNEWWADSTECYCYLRNIQDLLSDGKTPYERRFGLPFDGPIIPFGALVEYHPFFLRKTNLGCIRLEQKSCQVYFLVMHYTRVESGKETLWSQTLRNWRRWTHQKLHARRLSAKEVSTPQRSGNFIFPVADGTVKIFGREQRLRTSTLTRGSVQNEDKNKKFLKESQMNYILQPHFKTTQRAMMRKQNMTSGLLQETSFIVIMLNPQSNCTCREKNHSLFR